MNWSNPQKQLLRPHKHTARGMKEEVKILRLLFTGGITKAPKSDLQSLGWEDSLEKEMATHSSTLAWKIPWMEEPGGLQSMGLQRVRHN